MVMNTLHDDSIKSTLKWNCIINGFGTLERPLRELSHDSVDFLSGVPGSTG